MWLPSTRFPSLLINPTRPHPLVSRGSLYLLLFLLMVTCLIPSCKYLIPPLPRHPDQADPLFMEEILLKLRDVYLVLDQPCQYPGSINGTDGHKPFKPACLKYKAPVESAFGVFNA